MRRRIPPRSGTAFRLKRGQVLRVIDPEGGQVADLFCVDAENPRDALSSGRSIDYNETVRFGRGHRLYAASGNVMLEIGEDRCGVHDFLVTPCSRQMFEMISGEKSHPSCEDNLHRALREFRVDPTLVATTFNVFMNVPVDGRGKIRVLPPTSKPGDHADFIAHRDLIVGLTACSDEGTNGGSCKPIAYEILDSPP